MGVFASLLILLCVCVHVESISLPERTTSNKILSVQFQLDQVLQNVTVEFQKCVSIYNISTNPMGMVWQPVEPIFD